jgi:predicted ArsR family transcriptional regulator
MALSLLDGARRSLLDLIKRQGSISIDDATERVKLAKTTVRQHLLQMEDQGLIRRSYDKQQPGRPKVVFELSEAGQRLYPTQEPALLRELLEFLDKDGQHSAMERFFEEYWKKRRKRFEEILESLGGRTDTRARAEALMRLLEAEGFMPHLAQGPGRKLTVRECNCPFQEAVRATRLPCKLESEFIRWALKSSVERTEYIPDGEASCTYAERK